MDGGRQLLPEIFWSENGDFKSIFARSASAVSLAKKVQLTLTNEKST